MTTTASAPRLETDALSLHRFSTDEYVLMVEAGALVRSKKVELIDGIIVDMSPAGRLLP